MDNYLTIPSKIDNEVLEKLLNKINNNLYTRLKISKNITSKKLGIQPILLQVISSFFMRNKDVTVEVSSITDGDIVSFSKNFVYISSILRASRLHDATGKKYRSKFMEKTIDFLNNMHENSKISNTCHGPCVQYVCFDWSDNFSNLETIYNGESLISKEEFLKTTAPSIFENTISQANSWLEKKRSIISDFGSILYELFLNTEEHTRDNSLEKQSIRGIFSRSLIITADSAKKNYTHIEKYLNHLQEYQVEMNPFLTRAANPPNEASLQFIEISVTDTGDGLGKSMSKDTTLLTFEDEKVYVLRCFNKHATSKINGIYGIGLFEVIEKVVKHKGLFVLRTGKINITVDYLSINIDGDIVSFDCDIKEHEEIVGTSFTIILPLIYEVSDVS